MASVEGNAVYRFTVASGNLLAVNHDVNGFQVSLHYWEKDGREIIVRREAYVSQSLRDAVTAVMNKAGRTRDAKQIVDYIRGTEWGRQWPEDSGENG